MLIDAGSSTLLAYVPSPAMLTDAVTSALLALAANSPPVLTDVGSSALLAHTAPLPVLTDADTSALLALQTRPCGQMLAPPHSLHTLRRCPC